MPNLVAYVVLFSWPVVVFLLFRTMPKSHALVWSIIGGYLLLPYGVGINPPLLPTLDKTLIPAMAAAAMCFLMKEARPEATAVAGLQGRPSPRAILASDDGATESPPAEGVAPENVVRSGYTRQAVRRPTRSASGRTDTSTEASTEAAMDPAKIRLMPVPRVIIGLIGLLILTQLLTVQTNGAAYPVGPRKLQGLSWYDASSMILSAVVMILPFLLGLRFLARPNQQGILLRIFCLSGLLYSLPTLLEIRLSPQLSKWTYGFLAQSFAQAKRDDGFRPVVYLQHGLWLAIFLAMAALAGFALWRYRKGMGTRANWLLAGLWIAGVLLFCRSLGAMLVLMLLAPAVLFLTVRLQIMLAALIALMVLTYPMLRGADLVPVGSLYQMAASVSAERAESLQFRFDNEDQLLAHANDRPMAGWGGYGRARLHDPKTGLNISTTDGIWVILMGESGWFGYIATFGLLTTPILLLLWRSRQLMPDAASAGLCLMLAANLIDMIPNATMTPLTWLIAGALAGRCRVPGLAAPEVAKRMPQPNPGRSQRLARPAVSAALALMIMIGGALAEGGRAPALAQDAAAVPPGQGLTNPILAFGLAGISDSSTARPFLDLMKESRPFVGHDKKSWSAFSNDDLAAGGWLDDEGWPKQIPPGATAVGTIWSWGKRGGDPTAAASREGVYVLTYKGKGDLRLDGDVEVLSAEPGRMVLRNLNGRVMSLDIAVTDPDGTGDYIRDITLVPQRYEALFHAGEIFNPDWLALVQDARQLRFMDWMRTNGATGAHWEKRPLPGDASWAMRGVPVEVMVQLANQIGTEPWFTMPMGADEAYIRNFATYVRDHLNPDLRVHAEYSNETWNWAFDQTQWLLEQGKTVWSSDDERAYIDYNAMLATKSALIWREVFGGQTFGDQTKARLDTVLGIQTGSSNNAERLLTAPLWQEKDPAGYVAPASAFTSLAVTTYFGSQTMAKPDLREALLAAIQGGRRAAADQLTQQLLDPSYPASIPQIVKRWQESKEVARKYGLDFVAYEGGQHILQSFRLKGISDEDMALLTEFLTAYVRSSYMMELYDQLWRAWAEVGQGPFMHFTDVDGISKFGAWGLYQSLGDRNPRADLLARLNGEEKSWFGDGGGVRYQQGVIRLAEAGGETLEGTDKDDFLIGGAGADTIVSGKGQDTIAGGEGVDVLVLSGAPDDYRLGPDVVPDWAPDRTPDQTPDQTLGPTAAVMRLTGPGLVARVSGIESFRFAGGVIRTEAEMAHD